MANKYFVEFKNKQGEWEPLGIMTRLDAVCWSWDHEHAPIRQPAFRLSRPARPPHKEV